MTTAGPNFLFILVDDLGYRDLGCYGSSFYESPNIDHLAAEGTMFTDAYAAAPVCSPTRASILTGAYPARVGVTDFISWSGSGHPARGLLVDAPYVDHLPLEAPNLARVFSELGYATWHVGKWHLGSRRYYPDRQGFELNIGGFEAGMPPNGYFSPWRIPTLPDGPEGEYLTDRLTDEAIALIRNRGDRPFFLNLWYYAVHIPIEAPPELVEKYRRKAVDRGLNAHSPFVEGAFYPTEHKRDIRMVRRVVQSDPGYAAMIERLDWNIGRLLAAVEDEGLASNTVVVFTSDNGGLSTAEGSPTSNLPLAEGKGWTFEGGVRVPLILRPARSQAHVARCNRVVTSPDFFPTLLDLVGPARGDRFVDRSSGDGVSFAGIWNGETAEEDRADTRPVFWHYPHYGNQGGSPASAVRRGRYKLIEYFEDGHRELYDLHGDIGEKDDIASARPEISEELGRLLSQWRESVEALVPGPNPDFVPWPDRARPGNTVRFTGPFEPGAECV